MNNTLDIQTAGRVDKAAYANEKLLSIQKNADALLERMLREIKRSKDYTPATAPIVIGWAEFAHNLGKRDFSPIAKGLSIDDLINTIKREFASVFTEEQLYACEATVTAAYGFTAPLISKRMARKDFRRAFIDGYGSSSKNKAVEGNIQLSHIQTYSDSMFEQRMAEVKESTVHTPTTAAITISWAELAYNMGNNHFSPIPRDLSISNVVDNIKKEYSEVFTEKQLKKFIITVETAYNLSNPDKQPPVETLNK